jgi:tetratricopeptide (TPR) repeat protein
MQDTLLESRIIGEIAAGNAYDPETVFAVFSTLGDGDDPKAAQSRVIRAKFTLDCLQDMVLDDVPRFKDMGDYDKAKSLYYSLWQRMPRRFRRTDHSGPNTNFLLLDSLKQYEAADSKGIANCLGLTQIYTSLAVRFGMPVAAYVEAYHVHNVVWADDRTVHVEHTAVMGFDQDFNQSECILPECFPALIIASRGREKLRRGDYDGALKDVENALFMHPDYAAGHLYRSLLHVEAGDEDAAYQSLAHACSIDADVVGKFTRKRNKPFTPPEYKFLLDNGQIAVGAYFLTQRNGLVQ